ncbi:MAG: tetratricopeptide repeat protein [Ignavibacteriaceae bacterium]|nr:tetratricopeptide repeat protein [Ignavibacteriaceae bacterium]
MLKKIITEIKARKIRKWLAIHISTALTTIGAINLISSRYNLPDIIFDVAFIVAVCTLPVTLVMAWFHSGDQPKKIRKSEIAFYSLVMIGMLFLLVNRIFLTGEEQIEVVEKSIAVLPFKNFGDSKEDEYFADGVTEDILTQLSKVNNLKVISRTSVMKYKNSSKTMREIAKELGVESVLEGSVRRTKDRVRIVGQLIDAKTDKHIWAETYDREIKDIFEIQSEVAQKITAALMITLSEKEKEKIEKKPTNNIEAYTYYLKGRDYLNRLTPDDIETAVMFFKKALQYDPGYALAYAGLGEAYAQKFRAFGLGDQWSDSSRVMCEKAIKLDPQIAEPYIALGLNLFYNGKMHLALEQYLKAVNINPGSFAAADVGQVLFLLGSLSESIPWLEKSIKIDPTRWNGYRNLGLVKFALGRYEEAERFFLKVLELMPEHTYVLVDLTRLYMLTGQIPKAEALLKKAFENNPESGRVNFCLGELNMFNGNFKAAKNYIKKSIEVSSIEYGPAVEYAFLLKREGEAKRSSEIFENVIKYDEAEITLGMENHNYPYELARSYSVIGNKKKSLENLKLAIKYGWRFYLYTKADPLLENVRTDSQFTSLLNEIKKEIERMGGKVI